MPLIADKRFNQTVDYHFLRKNYSVSWSKNKLLPLLRGARLGRATERSRFWSVDIGKLQRSRPLCTFVSSVPRASCISPIGKGHT